MSALQPMAVYALKVDPGEEMVPAMPDFAAMFRITMAAIDPSEDPDAVDIDPTTMTQRSTLKIIRVLVEDDSDDEEDSDYDDLLAEDEDDDDDEDDEDDEETNGGPSDPTKARKPSKKALLEALAADLEEDEDMDEDDDDGDSDVDEAEALATLKALTKKGKGKAKAIDGDEDDDEDDDSIDSDEALELGITEMAVCTLDTRSQYQQTLDLTIGEDERVFFKVVGSHPIYLTGNYVIPADYANAALLDSDEEDDEYDLSPDEDEELEALDGIADGVSEDDLDDLPDPRVTEVDSEEEAPKLLTGKKEQDKKDKSSGKGKNKRPAEDSDDEPALDDIMAKSIKKEEATTTSEPVAVNGEAKKLSKAEKKALKKLKKNDGTATEATASSSTPEKTKESASNGAASSEKKVQFDKNLVKGPTPNGDSKGATPASNSTSGSKSISVREVNGVTIDERKLGNGHAAKKGSKLQMRYIGKLDDGKIFDSNKSGKPFSFKLGAGVVIKGWDIGLEGIKPGGERRIIIPAHLAYGKKSMPGIPSNSKLTFDIKCLGVE